MSSVDPRSAAKVDQLEKLIVDLRATKDRLPHGQRASINRRQLSAQFLLAIYRTGYVDPMDARHS